MNEDSGSNYMRAHYTLGRELLDRSEDMIRRMVEQCESLQGMIMHHSLVGGTGSGIGSYLIERLK